MRSRLSIALALLLLLSGCPHFDGAGRYACSSDNDCPNGEKCDENRECIGRPDWATCSSSSDCPSGYDCLAKWSTGAHVCQRVCKSVDDCIGGFRCQSGHCVPNYCSPYGRKPWDKLPVQTVNYFLGPCSAHNAGSDDGTCVGPLDPGSGLVQDSSDYIGLCYLAGTVSPGLDCVENVLNVDVSGNCVQGEFCGVSIPGYHVAKCRRLCGPRQQFCPSGEGCWLVWGSNGICVPQHTGWPDLDAGAPCVNVYPGGGATNQECNGAAVCATRSDGGTVCEPTCISDFDCNSDVDGGTGGGSDAGFRCTAVPNAPPGAGYCPF